MRKSSNKLVISAFLAVTAIALMVTASYAWYTLAGSPSLAGVQINIGGTNTIQIAPDLVEVIDGVEVHYPGHFQETLKVSNHREYDYLKSVAGLMPVSTADGIHWFYPPNPGVAVEEQNLTLTNYALDETLVYGNLSKESVGEAEGGYVYVDFWVVAPMDNCKLRLSVGSEDNGVISEGCYVVSLPKLKEVSDSTTLYEIDSEDNQAQASVRLGFLVNKNVSSDLALTQYTKSDGYNDKYRKLYGVYQQSGNALSEEEKEAHDFLIYEPNGDSHPSKGLSYVTDADGLTYSTCEDGDYAVTYPIGKKDGEIVATDVVDRLVVQKTNQWKDTLYNQAALEQCSGYINRGKFFASTQLLYYAGSGGVVNQENMGYLETTTATENGVIVELERNVPQRIRMFVWMEGQDVDCVREASSETLAIGIEFAGGTQY